jgi:hypothetical protein
MDGITEAISNVTNSLGPWWNTIYWFGLIIGLFFIIKAIVDEVSDSHNRHQQGWHGGSVTLISGLFLVNLKTFINTFSQTLFKTDSATGLSYSTGGSDPFDIYIQFAVYIIMLVGLIGTIKGVMMMKASKSNASQLGAAITHMVGGVLAINIIQVLHMFGATVGGGVESFISTNL